MIDMMMMDMIIDDGGVTMVLNIFSNGCHLSLKPPTSSTLQTDLENKLKKIDECPEAGLAISSWLE